MAASVEAQAYNLGRDKMFYRAVNALLTSMKTMEDGVQSIASSGLRPGESNALTAQARMLKAENRALRIELYQRAQR